MLYKGVLFSISMTKLYVQKAGADPHFFVEGAQTGPLSGGGGGLWVLPQKNLRICKQGAQQLEKCLNFQASLDKYLNFGRVL